MDRMATLLLVVVFFLSKLHTVLHSGCTNLQFPLII